MHIDHLAIRVRDIESMKDFYLKYFNCKAGPKYVNPAKWFESYFLEFDGETRIELMMNPVRVNSGQEANVTGLEHFALSVGSEAAVRELTEQLRRDGFTVTSEPRRTGDGYFECCILDPEGNHIEITALPRE